MAIPNTYAPLLKDAFAENANAPMLDPTFGGQNGYMNNISEFHSNQAYLRRNIVCILMDYPHYFDLLGQAYVAKRVQILKAMLEYHTQSIDGLKSMIEWEFESHRIGAAGEQQEEVTDAKREQSRPKHTIIEKIGRPFSTLLNEWGRFGMMDPDTKHPLISTLARNVIPDDYLAHYFTMTCLYFEPDINFKKVVKAWMCTNMMPRNDGPNEGSRDQSRAIELTTLDAEFTSITASTFGTIQVAQKILDAINYQNAVPGFRKSFVSDIDPTVKAAERGYQFDVQRTGSESVKHLG